jgi:haloalkane dehalogenase
MRILRTPDERFAALPDYPLAPHYIDVDSGDGQPLRMHYLDEGPRDGAIVLMLHGEPTWSYLYRTVIQRVVASGLRAIAPDLPGFGRSDKPADRADYTYARHLAWLLSFLDTLGLRHINLLCQDWGGLLGLRLVAEHPGRFDRVIAANTSLPTGDRPPPEAFLMWQQMSQTLPEFVAGRIVQRFCLRPMSDAVAAAYDAPYPDDNFTAGARKFPLLVPTSPQDPESEPNRRAWESLAQFSRPFLTIFGDSDPITSGAERNLQRKIPGAAGQPHRVLAGVGHFIQEDAGEELGTLTAAFVNSSGTR